MFSNLRQIADKIINIEKSIIINDIEKSRRKRSIGEVVTRKDGKKYRKIAETGDSSKDWKLVSDKKGVKDDEESGSTPKGDLDEYAKKSSKTALENAIKNSDDPDLRVSAQKELARREKEESVSDDITDENKDNPKKCTERYERR